MELEFKSRNKYFKVIFRVRQSQISSGTLRESLRSVSFNPLLGACPWHPSHRVGRIGSIHSRRPPAKYPVGCVWGGLREFVGCAGVFEYICVGVRAGVCVLNCFCACLMCVCDRSRSEAYCRRAWRFAVRFDILGSTLSKGLKLGRGLARERLPLWVEIVSQN